MLGSDSEGFGIGLHQQRGMDNSWSTNRFREGNQDLFGNHRSKNRSFSMNEFEKPKGKQSQFHSQNRDGDRSATQFSQNKPLVNQENQSNRYHNRVKNLQDKPESTNRQNNQQNHSNMRPNKLNEHKRPKDERDNFQTNHQKASNTAQIKQVNDTHFYFNESMRDFLVNSTSRADKFYRKPFYGSSFDKDSFKKDIFSMFGFNSKNSSNSNSSMTANSWIKVFQNIFNKFQSFKARNQNFGEQNTIFGNAWHKSSKKTRFVLFFFKLYLCIYFLRCFLSLSLSSIFCEFHSVNYSLIF